MKWAAFVGSLVLATVVVGSANSHAQTPPPGATVTVFPYRFTVNGPASARSGEQVTYQVRYELTDASSPSAGSGIDFAFIWWPPSSVSFVSSAVIEGPGGSYLFQTPDSLRWSVNKPSGVVEVVLRIEPGFTGKLRAGTYLFGTAVSAAAGSVEHVSTQVVSAPASNTTSGLPTTEDGSDPEDRTPLVALLGAAGLVVVAAGGALWRIAAQRKAS